MNMQTKTVADLKGLLESAIYLTGVPIEDLKAECLLIENALSRVKTPRAAAIAQAIRLRVAQSANDRVGMASAYVFASQVSIGML